MLSIDHYHYNLTMSRGFENTQLKLYADTYMQIALKGRGQTAMKSRFI